MIFDLSHAYHAEVVKYCLISSAPLSYSSYFEEMKTRLLNALLLFSCLLISPVKQEASQHDGSTVDKMLSRFNCKDQDCSSEVDQLCWGYEKKCSKQRRLFVPRCEGPAKPW